MTLLTITEHVREEMIEKAKRDRPHETCAFLLGEDDHIDEYYEMKNINQGLEELLEIEGFSQGLLDQLDNELALNDESGKTNVNKATREELQQLNGINEELADRIIQRRQRAGRYEDPEIHFKFDPGDQAKAQKYSIQNQTDIVGVYHSHPHHDSEAYPSDADQEMGHKGYIYFILNFQPEETIIRAFEMGDEAVEEIEFEVTDS
ncbi:MAG: Mov34/MPN/PAD-1 family protein [bacterium]